LVLVTHAVVAQHPKDESSSGERALRHHTRDRSQTMTGPVSLIVTRAQLVALFRPLVGVEAELADLLLEAATNRIRRKFADAGATLVESDAEVRLVILEVVRTAIRNASNEFGGLKQIAFTTDDATEQRVFANPGAQLDFTDAHWERLGLDLSVSPRGHFPVDDY
jgi:hypothetical protein